MVSSNRRRALVLEIVADTKQATSGFGSFRKAINSNVAKIGAAFGGVQIARFIGDTITAANDLNESINAVNVVFGEASRTIAKFGQTSAQEVGLSTRAFNDLATVTGSILRNSEVPGFADVTVELTRRAADLASVFNTDVGQAMAAVNSALIGQSEPIRKYGVTITAAGVASEAAALGFEELDEQAKKLATVSLIMKQTEAVAGDFADTLGDSLANQSRVVAAEWENLQAQLGQNALPLAVEGMKLLNTALVNAGGAANNFQLGASWLFTGGRTDRNSAQQAALVAQNRLNELLRDGVDPAGALGTALALVTLNTDGTTEAYTKFFDRVGASNAEVFKATELLLEYGEANNFTEEQLAGLNRELLRARGAIQASGIDEKFAEDARLLAAAQLGVAAANLEVAATAEELLPVLERLGFRNYDDARAAQDRADSYNAANAAMAAIERRRFEAHVREISAAWNDQARDIEQANEALAEQIELRNIYSQLPGSGGGGGGTGPIGPLSVPSDAGATIVTVNVNGAIDSVAAGREVNRVLRRYGAVTGG